MKAKRPSDSLTIMTELVLPNDTNNLNNLFGGQLLSWMDRCSAIAAHRHSKTIVVTASVNNVSDVMTKANDESTLKYLQPRLCGHTGTRGDVFELDVKKSDYLPP